MRTSPEKTGAVSTLHYDYLLDAFQGTVSENSFVAETGESCGLQPVYGQHYKEKLYGREPEAQNEALLYLPVSYRPKFGMKDDFVRHIAFCELEYDVVGVQYYYDNNLTPKLVLTEDGFACAMAAFLLNDADQTVRVGFQSAGGSFNWQPVDMILPSFLLPEGRAYVSLDSFTAALDARTAAGSIPAAAVEISAYFRINNSFLAQFMGNQKAFSAEEIFPGDFYLREKPGELGAYAPKAAAGKSFLAVNVNSLRKLMEGYLAGSYTQASLFYASEKKAQAASDTLRTMGYTSALSTDKYSPQAYETVLSSAEGIFLLLLWILTVIFLSFFINLCTGKAIGAFRHDLAILRSMGIPVKTIIVGLFTRLYISLLPAVGFGLILALFLYRTPKGNAAFPYLYGWQYLMIFTGLLLMATRVGRKQVKKLFGESVREALRGGDEA